MADKTYGGVFCAWRQTHLSGCQGNRQDSDHSGCETLLVVVVGAQCDNINVNKHSWCSTSCGGGKSLAARHVEGSLFADIHLLNFLLLLDA